MPPFRRPGITSAVIALGYSSGRPNQEHAPPTPSPWDNLRSRIKSYRNVKTPAPRLKEKSDLTFPFFLESFPRLFFLSALNFSFPIKFFKNHFLKIRDLLIKSKLTSDLPNFGRTAASPIFTRVSKVFKFAKYEFFNTKYEFFNTQISPNYEFFNTQIRKIRVVIV